MEIVPIKRDVERALWNCHPFSAFDHLLVFGRTGLSSTVTVTLPAGAYVEYGYAPESLPGVQIEIVSLKTGRTLGHKVFPE